MNKILVIDDDINLNKVLSYQLQKNGFETQSANKGQEGIVLFTKNNFDIVVTDVQMPDISGIEVLQEIRRINKKVIIIIITAYGSVDSAIEACRLGADDYLTKPFGQEQLLFTIRKAIKLRDLQSENIQLKSQLFDKNKFDSIVTANKKMENVLQMTAQVALSDASVLIFGESGTGKELIARAIHYNSPRKDKPFITVNCPSIPQNLLESELFGHLKGSFTGAIKDRTGKFELADKGTLFLDEIGELPEELQSKLLRVLQEQKIEKLGDSKVKKLDVRVISATNRDLNKMIKNNKFREDLYFRIAVVPITIPPLRERLDDIPLLLDNFIRQYGGDRHIDIEQDVEELLQKYHWPGNVRELENVVERMLVFAKNNKIREKDIPGYMKQNNNFAIKDKNVQPDISSLDDIQKNAIVSALKNSGGNKSKAARTLEIPRHVLLYKMKKYNIN